MLIRGGTVADDGSERRADVLINGEKITAVGPGLDAEGQEVIDATGCYVLPGLVDPHTHFALDTGSGRTADDFESGSAAAAAGGVTTYINFATQRPGQTFHQAIESARKEAEGHSYVDYSFHLNITNLYPGWEHDLEAIVKDGITSAKVYTTYKGTVFYLDDWSIFRLMERAAQVGMLIQMHAENDDMIQGRIRELVAEGKTSLAYHGASRPAIAETEAVNRGLFFSRVTGCPIYFVHLSNPLSVDLVTEARTRGIQAFAETCPHYLVLDESLYAGPEPERYLMTPPLRSRELREGLWERLKRGQIHAVGSDHCGYSLSQRGTSKDFREVNPGIPGVETALRLLHTFGVCAGHIGFPDLVKLLSSGPASIFGLSPAKGHLQVGSDADLVIFDPRINRVLTPGELHGTAQFSPYESLELQGAVLVRLLRGSILDPALKMRPGLLQYRMSGN
jgi:dihydropyrimidinase